MHQMTKTKLPRLLCTYPYPSVVCMHHHGPLPDLKHADPRFVQRVSLSNSLRLGSCLNLQAVQGSSSRCPMFIIELHV